MSRMLAVILIAATGIWAAPMRTAPVAVPGLATIPGDAQWICASPRSGELHRSGKPSNELYACTPDGLTLTRITPHRKLYNHVAVSPDRKRILAGRFQHGDTNRNGRIDELDRKTLVVLDLEARQEWALLPELDAGEGGVDWTPDGEFVLASVRQNGVGDIHRIRPDGTGSENLTKNVGKLLGSSKPHFASGVSVSVDGKWIVFLYTESRKTPGRIVRMRIDGSEAHFVTGGGGPGQDSSTGPVVVPPDGSGYQRVPGLAGCTWVRRIPAAREASAGWKLIDTIALQATLHHVQGIDMEDDSLWVSSVDRPTRKGFLSRFSLPSGKLVTQVEVQEGQRFHPGGISLDGDSLWVPVAEYDRDGPTTVQRRDKASLALYDSFPVADHIGCIAAGPDFLIGGSWDSRTLYRWTKSGGLIGSQPSPSPIGYQDLKIRGPNLVGSGVRAKTGAVEWLALDGYRVLRRTGFGATDRGVPFTQEGMTIVGGKLYLLPEDDPARLFIFAPAPGPE